VMRLPRFRFQVPATVDDAIAQKREAPPDAAYVAGGTDLYPNMKRRHQEPSVVIALHAIDELQRIVTGADGAISIGATATLTEVATHPDVRVAYPALAETMHLISTPILQNMGTIGGNVLLDTRCNYYDQNYEWRKSIDFCMKKDGDVCWVAPQSPRCWAVQSADSVPLLVAMGATVDLVGPDGERSIPIEGLYQDDGILYLSKQQDELLTRIHLPSPNGWRSSYRKVRRRGAFDFPVLGVGAWAELDADGVVQGARIVLGGVASSPVVVETAAQALIGSSLSAEAIDEAAELAWKTGRPLDNTDFTLYWRKEMIRPTVRRALEDLASHR
jgi:4-hydroxybenzoyl-CoA reductase subunit beta